MQKLLWWCEAHQKIFFFFLVNPKALSCFVLSLKMDANKNKGRTAHAKLSQWMYVQVARTPADWLIVCFAWKCRQLFQLFFCLSFPGVLHLCLPHASSIVTLTDEFSVRAKLNKAHADTYSIKTKSWVRRRGKEPEGETVGVFSSAG